MPLSNAEREEPFQRFAKAKRFFSSCAIWFLTLAIRAYQLTVSPLQTYLFGVTGGCRYTPSCSAYAAEALREHGVAAGTFLAVKRICRCHPWGGCGHDPVPAKAEPRLGGRMTKAEGGYSLGLSLFPPIDHQTVGERFPLTLTFSPKGERENAPAPSASRNPTYI